MNVKELFSRSRERNVLIVLRIVLAVIFALTAFIFTEVLPDLPPFNKTVLRVLITVWFGLMGYGLFPDIARALTSAALNIINNFVTKISTEVTNQVIRLQSRQGSFGASSLNQITPIGGASINQPLILDTSAIIDGRILDIAKTAFLHGTILIPSFVLAELQQVSDSADYIKRSRGRRGFEIINDLKKTKGIRIEVWDKDVTAKTVDDQLLKLAKSLHGRIITTDFNLNRVALVSNITVLNINDLANAVKTVAVPGESLTLKIVHLGKDPKQGVGYLPDGTMIVVENGAQMIGKEVKSEVSRVLQSSAGRMIFVRASKETLES